MTERRHIVVSRREIFIGKVSPRPHEYFSVAGLRMALLGQPKFAVRYEYGLNDNNNRMIMPPIAYSVNQSCGDVWIDQIDSGKVSPRPWEYFGVVGWVITSLGGLLSVIQYLTPLPLMTSGGQTAGCDSERFDMCDSSHLPIVCYF